MYRTVQDLIDALEGMDPNAEVRIACQPSWPLRARVQNIVEQSEMEPDDDEPDDDEPSSDENFVWIAVDQVSASSENPYAPREAWAA